MKQMLAIVCKQQPTQEQATQIEAALSGFAAAGNYINNTLNFKQTNNYQQWLNHNICRVTLDRAKSGNLVVAIEKLTSIRERTNQILRSQEGLRLVKVNHACTSQTCHKCNHIPPKTGKSYRKVKNFICGHCGWLSDAGSSGVLNISALGASVNRHRWHPSSKTCSHSSHVLDHLDLSVRQWRCPSCQAVNGRDENAAKNIAAVGASTVRLGDVRQAMPAIAV
jgi:hypothetical protein